MGIKLNLNDQRARVGIVYMQALRLNAEGEAAERRAKVFAIVGSKFEYAIDKSEKDLDREVSEPFLARARTELNLVLEMQNIALEEATAKYAEATELLGTIQDSRQSDVEWPEFFD